MNGTIRKTVVIGSGVMGAAIAAHLANAGLECLLLDRVPDTLTDEETAKGWTAEHPSYRSRLAREALNKLTRQQPAPLYDPALAARITPGNIEDHLSWVSEADWIIEAVVEDLDVKRLLFERLEAHWRPGTIVSTNTSGISIAAILEQRGEAFRRHVLGTHFFNPPRYMKLLELIPGPDTDRDTLFRVKSFAERTLGKRVVIAKDTPNFIANRIGTYGLLVTLQAMEAGGFTVEEADAVTGPALGRPKSATFRTLDLVGLDTFARVAATAYTQATDDHDKAVFAPSPVIERMLERGLLGEKSGRGFYVKRKGAQGQNEILALRLGTLDYAPQSKPASPSLEAAKRAKGASAKIRELLAGEDRYARFAWDILKQVLLYAASKAGEIADRLEDIDEAMRSGFHWELGPFETWDVIGLESSVRRMEAEGLRVPDWVTAWLAAGNRSFYERRSGNALVLSLQPGAGYVPLERAPEAISLRGLKEAGRTVRSNSGASLIDLGGGAACLEFHSRSNAIGADILQMIHQSLDAVERDFDGLVIANQGKNFCVGANLMLLLMEAQAGEWDEIDDIIRLFQNTMRRLRYFGKPVVAAPHGMTLGGGVEVCFPADRVVASAETYYGLVETGVGLIPAGGGCTELARRIAGRTASPETERLPYLAQAFENVGMAKVSSSAHDAVRLGLLTAEDRIVLHPDHHIHEAKQEVLRLAQAGYTPRREERIRVAGADGKAALAVAAYGLREGGYISDHDLLIAGKLAHVLAGGDVPPGTDVSEQYVLDLEREAFLSLCGEEKTRQRMQHMLERGKPLRN